MLSADVNSNTRLHSIALYEFLKSCSGPPKFKNIRGPLGPGPAGPLVNASLLSLANFILSGDQLSSQQIAQAFCHTPLSCQTKFFTVPFVEVVLFVNNLSFVVFHRSS